MRAATRDKILRAARKLFVQRGFAATSMAAIVKLAGTSIGNLYFYFDNKESLLATLAEMSLRAAWARGDELMAAVPAGPARVAAMVYANAYGLMVTDRDILQMEIVARDDEDLAQDLIQIKGRQHRLARIVKDRDFLHSADEFYMFAGRLRRFRK